MAEGAPTRAPPSPPTPRFIERPAAAPSTAEPAPSTVPVSAGSARRNAPYGAGHPGSQEAIMARPKRLPVQGSERAEMPAARVVGPVGDDELVDVTIRVRSASGGLAPRAATAAPMTREELAQQAGASPDDLRVVEDFAHEHGLTVLGASPAERAVRLRGPAGAMQSAFGVLLNRVEHPGGTFRQRTGAVQVPAALAEIVTGVFGLDDRPQARPHFRVAPGAPAAGGVAAPKAAPHVAGGSFTPPQLAQIYDFPKGFNGQGQTIGILELGGGYRKADLDAYAAGLGLQPFQVVAVSV